MKRIIALLVIAVFVAGLAASCGPDNKKDTEKEKQTEKDKEKWKEKEKPPVPEGGILIEKGGWYLVITYYHKGTRSEHQEGTLYKGLKVIPAGKEGDTMDTPLGKMKYYGEKPASPGSPTGWNYEDKGEIEKNASTHD
jgi:hypothetical protein